MSPRVKRLGFLVLAISALLLYWGCSQPDDVITPVVSSRLTLSPERLPTNPAGTVYELWAAGDGDTVPVAKFSWNFDSNAFYDSTGTAKRADSNSFLLRGDVLNLRTIIVSVEPVPDPRPKSPNAIMLIDTVVTLEPNTTRLRFPRTDSLYNSFTFINFETPSDSDQSANDGYGVWFSGHQVQQYWLRDTLSLDNYVIDTSDQCDSLGPPNCQDSIVLVDLTNFRTITVKRYYGIDTFSAQVVRYDSIIRYDAIPPFINDTVGRTYTMNPAHDSISILADDFYPADNYVPDLSAFGWVYRGWVMSPALNSGCGNATFSKPAWSNTAAINEYLPQNSSMLISTGKFKDFAHKNVGANPHPYAAGPRTPNIPGEDFLDNLPCGGGLPAGGFVPSGGGAVGANGCVFVTLEPANFSGATNFPLVVLTANIPTNRNVISTGGTGQASQVQISMRNWTSATAGDLQGFPLVVVNIERL